MYSIFTTSFRETTNNGNNVENEGENIRMAGENENRGRSMSLESNSNHVQGKLIVF